MDGEVMGSDEHMNQFAGFDPGGFHTRNDSGDAADVMAEDLKSDLG
jgi:hypothetical protein